MSVKMWKGMGRGNMDVFEDCKIVLLRELDEGET